LFVKSRSGRLWQMSIKTITEYVRLYNNVDLPAVGFGVFLIKPGKETVQCVETALQAGYRSIDTATFYENEADVGRAIRQSGIPREEVFITTKVWPTDHGYDQTLHAFHKSLDRLQTGYVDLYLIHWPRESKSVETWKALETLYKNKEVRAIGLSNYTIRHIELLKEHWEIPAMVNQIEYHPYLQQPALSNFCRRNAIQVEAWSPLMRGEILYNTTIKNLAAKYQRTPAQVTLRWELQKGIVVIPKSIHKNRIIENRNLFDFTISEADMKKIDALDKSERIGPDPHTINF
jgi:diketogulonate reductase-like aldo/keto reductase